MKKALLAVIVLSFFSVAQLHAQCSPDLAITTPGVYPDSLTNLDTGYVSQLYSDTIQFKVYSTVTPVTVDSVRIMSITGLPSGLSTSSNPSGMLFAGGSNGCVLISGTPSGPVQTYPLIINLRFYGHILSSPLTIDTTDDDYRIVLQPFSGIQVISPATFEVSQNVPNPFNVQTEINFTVPSSAKADFRVYDMLGRELIQRNIDAVTGSNRITLSSRYFKPGIYFYRLNYKNKSLTRKMIVTAKP